MLQIYNISWSEVHVMNVTVCYVGRRNHLLIWELFALENYLSLSHIARTGVILLLLLYSLIRVTILTSSLRFLPHSIYLRQLLLVSKLHLKNLLPCQLWRNHLDWTVRSYPLGDKWLVHLLLLPIHKRCLRHLHHLSLVGDLSLSLLKCIISHCISTAWGILRSILTCQDKVLLGLLLAEEIMRWRRFIHPSILVDLVLLIANLDVLLLI